MLQFLDQLKEGYAKADKALGGFLPGGGTANPLSDAVRPALEAVAPNSPPVQNYYREKKNTHIEQGKAAEWEASQARTQLIDRANNSAMETAQNQSELFDQFRENIRNDTAGAARVDALRDRAARHGIVNMGLEYGNGRLTDREFVQEMEANQNLSADEIDLVSVSYDNRDEARNEIAKRKERKTTKAQGVSWQAAIDKTRNYDTKEFGNGGLACVYGVNKVIKAAGKEVPWKDPETGQESTYIPFVENWIMSNGGKVVPHSEAKPGDIYSDGGHLGIVSNQVDGNGRPVILSNSSSRGSMSWEFPLFEKSQANIYRVPQLQN